MVGHFLEGLVDTSIRINSKVKSVFILKKGKECFLGPKEKGAAIIK